MVLKVMNCHKINWLVEAYREFRESNEGRTVRIVDRADKKAIEKIFREVIGNGTDDDHLLLLALMKIIVVETGDQIIALYEKFLRKEHNNCTKEKAIEICELINNSLNSKIAGGENDFKLEF